MMVGIPRESAPGERRVAMVPSVMAAIAKAGLEITVESGAGGEAGYADADYREGNASVVDTRAEVFGRADVILQVHGLGTNPDAGQADLALVRQGQVLIGFHDPLAQPQLAAELAAKGATILALELLPRITRAQSMDTLSSMATVAGYKAVLIAAEALPRMFPMLMTAAGTVAPARVFVIGAGVAGLQAIATAKRLGAIVQAYDVRDAVKEQVESLGGKFVELGLETGGAEDKGGYAKAMGEEFYRRQREVMARVIAGSDVVITTAAVPGKKAPILITREMVEGMAPRSVIVDLAAESGGNCELTRAGENVVHHFVTIMGPVNVPSTVPYHASQMYARNIQTLLTYLVKDGKLQFDRDDEIVAGTLVALNGEIVHPQVRELLGMPAAVKTEGSAD
ncbi:MAG TPA: Re/Si-specific NAD(P)(+) transhydrogenase subunit alpha [Acidobacteriota bacterium]|nr:Re/Si-specific NAD(P)(+) transhydrogenase subunit alpha [Acidobacteriota bacterium]